MLLVEDGCELAHPKGGSEETVLFPSNHSARDSSRLP